MTSEMQRGARTLGALVLTALFGSLLVFGVGFAESGARPICAADPESGRVGGAVRAANDEHTLGSL